MAVLAYFIAKLFKKFIKKEKFDVLPRILSALAAEAVMVGGYFFYEAVCLGLGLGAAAGIVSNVLQGSVALFSAPRFWWERCIPCAPSATSFRSSVENSRQKTDRVRALRTLSYFFIL